MKLLNIYYRKEIKLIKAVILGWLLIVTNESYGQQKVFNTSFYERIRLGPILMESTFYIYDPLNENKAGTCFVLAHIVSVDSSTKVVDSTFLKINKVPIFSYTKYRYCEILVTAAHILKDIEGDYAQLILRRKRGNDFETFDYPIKIREKGVSKWRQDDKEVDVAAMVISLPKDAVYSILVDSYLFYGLSLDIVNINAGDDISCLGFPYKTPSDNKYFPILRSGKYASYRGSHSSKDNSFLFDFKIYPGNSGGPVFNDLKTTLTKNALPWYHSASILGVVSEQLKSNDKMHEIDVAKVISAQYIFNSMTRLLISDSSIKNYDANKEE